ncbi:spore germination protein GerKB [Fictibacillus macauensis ZFHKF-1]|uniref:Spore germination protein GerKB n=1 Tax=Fictibacillus macauensis ZFHKF-1 TaxID=1196324 RepID=I8UCB1_9BACL|nr:endospore germination permease [Fictibacillus macauensis]EIT84540.1 spore germination protein GerKB [Fictibacillus macauensis ZFHKF-1]
MVNDHEKIGTVQLAFLIVQTQIGVGILSLPFTVQASAGGDGWISVIVGGLAVNALIYLMIALTKRFPSLSLVEYLPLILGRYAGKILGFIYIIYFLSTASLVLVLAMRIIYEWILSDTPRWSVLLLIMIPSIYLAKEPLRIIARFHGFVSFLIVVLVGMICYSYLDVDIRYLLPVGHSGLLAILKGSKDAILSLLGFELLLIIFPMLQHQKKALKAATIANLSVTLIYVFIVITALISFSPKEIVLVPEPVLYMLKAYSSRIFERLDLLLLSIWMVTVTTSYISYLYMAGKSLQQLYGMTKQSYAVYAAAFATIWMPMIVSKDLQVTKIGSFLSNTSYLFIAGIPIILLLISLLFKRKEGID